MPAVPLHTNTVAATVAFAAETRLQNRIQQHEDGSLLLSTLLAVLSQVSTGQCVVQ